MEHELVISNDGLPLSLSTYNVRQAAQALRLHPETVRDFLRFGRLSGFRVGNRWRVSAEVLSKVVKQGIPSRSQPKR